jgi:hypothetical protein
MKMNDLTLLQPLCGSQAEIKMAVKEDSNDDISGADLPLPLDLIVSSARLCSK